MSRVSDRGEYSYENLHTTESVMEHEEDYLLRIFSVLTVREILIFVPGTIRLNRGVRKNWSSLVDTVIHRAPSNVLRRMRRFAEARLSSSAWEVPRSEVETDNVDATRTGTTDDNMHRFPTTVTRETKRRCYAAFYRATSDTALRSQVCAVCARECGVMEEEVISMKLNRIPNRQRLVPISPHPAQQLIDDILLAPEGVHGEEEGLMADICRLCLHQLQNEKHSCPPRLALANGLWIGKVPMELEILTFPEQLLISLLYPRYVIDIDVLSNFLTVCRVYVFKLFPKKNAPGIPVEQLQRAMRGNVTTYELNQHDVTSMVEGRLMPRRPAILASLIAITFIGQGRLMKGQILPTFRVRRRVVHTALCWLKMNNADY